MQDKNQYNEQGQRHGFWDNKWNDDYRVCGNVVNGIVLGNWIWYRISDNYINDRTYYAR